MSIYKRGGLCYMMWGAGMNGNNKAAVVLKFCISLNIL